MPEWNWTELGFKAVPIAFGAVGAITSLAGFLLQRQRTDDEHLERRIRTLESELKGKEELIERLRNTIRSLPGYDPLMHDH